jgi:SpoVK/Ycf46/Vps4 family AAA+-type ATPase
MQDTEATGLLMIGPPGTSKSMFAKAAGNEGGVPTIALDLGGMKGSLVGESEQALRMALKVCDAVTQKRSLFIGTCNSIGALPPELRRRFNLGVVFLDLPNSSERKTIWDLYLNKYALPSQPIPTDDGWTGAEIRQCAWLAWDLKLSLKEASEYVVPVSRSASEQISKLRDSADGRYISASYPGVFLKAGPASDQAGRKMNLEVN